MGSPYVISATFHYFKGAEKKYKERHFSRANGDRIRGDDFELKEDSD